MIRIFSWILVLMVNTDDGLEPSDRLVPRGWEGNAWGPVATQAREAGSLPPVVLTPRMAQWDQWGRQVLRDGDIVFRRGDAHILFGLFPFSRFIANANNSLYSHTGVVSIENGAPVVYDTTKLGVRRQPFAVWTLDITGAFAVKRLRPELRDRIPAVLAFCRRAFAEQVPFDYNLRPDDESLYCVEMTEKAFRAAGLVLSEPILLGDMERATEFPLCMFGLWAVSQVALDQPLSFDQGVFFPGNERNGIWSSPYLETVTTWADEDVLRASGAHVGAHARGDSRGVRQVSGPTRH